MNRNFKQISILIITTLMMNAAVLSAQNDTPNNSDGKNEVFVEEKDFFTDSITGKDAARWLILGGIAPVTFLMGAKVWNWGDRHDPYTEREYWFGEDTDFGGSDKAGHFLAHYIMQRVAYSVFDWTEDGDDRKWTYSIGTIATVGLLIEIGDSYSSHYGFGVEDLMMDYSGILVAALLDYYPVLDGFFGFSIGYVPSSGYLDRFDSDSIMTSSFEIVNDYSGLQYLMNFKPAGFQNLGFDVPFALRILSIDLGWYTKGYSTSDRGEHALTKERDIFIGISINSAQLLSEIWPAGHRNKVYTASHKFLEYYHLPYEAIPIPTRYVRDLNE